jgi:hypothetical protein
MGRSGKVIEQGRLGRGLSFGLICWCSGLFAEVRGLAKRTFNAEALAYVLASLDASQIDIEMRG